MSYTENVKALSDKELLLMLNQEEEWNSDMLAAVEQELAARNKLPANTEEARAKQIEYEDEILSAGRPASDAGMTIGWICILGFVGLIIGARYAFSKVKSKYTGQTYYKYDLKSRKNGQLMFYVGIGVWSVGSFAALS